MPRAAVFVSMLFINSNLFDNSANYQIYYRIWAICACRCATSLFRVVRAIILWTHTTRRIIIDGWKAQSTMHRHRVVHEHPCRTLHKSAQPDHWTKTNNGVYSINGVRYVYLIRNAVEIKIFFSVYVGQLNCVLRFSFFYMGQPQLSVVIFYSMSKLYGTFESRIWMKIKKLSQIHGIHMYIYIIQYLFNR